MNRDWMQEDGHLTTVISLQTVFVGRLKHNYDNVILQDKGKEMPFRRSAQCFDVSPHGRLLQSHICCKNCCTRRYVIYRLLEMDIGVKTTNIRYTTGLHLPTGLELSVCTDVLGENFDRWLIDCPVALWNLFCVCLVSQHKGSVEPVFTNNTDLEKGNTLCALVTNVTASWETVAVKLLTPRDRDISDYWLKHK